MNNKSGLGENQNSKQKNDEMNGSSSKVAHKKSVMKYLPQMRVLFFALALFSFNCDSVEETVDNIDARITCEKYCTKKFDCLDTDPSDTEDDVCVTECRDSLEDLCGNDQQAAATDKVKECVDESCVDFAGCMVFDAAPECFDFAN